MADEDAKNLKDAETTAPVEEKAEDAAATATEAEINEATAEETKADEAEAKAADSNEADAEETDEAEVKEADKVESKEADETDTESKESETGAEETEKEAEAESDEKSSDAEKGKEEAAEEGSEADKSNTAEEKASKTYAKAGKKSRKHVEEVKAEEARQARKLERAAMEAAGEKPKGAAPVTRPRIERRGKKYQEAAKLVEKKKLYNLKDAIELAIKSNPAKFDASVEIHVRLGVDPRQADQNIRTTMVLPNGNGKEVRVAVFAPIDVCKTAKAAGADIADDEDFIKQLEKGNIDFDVLISTPQYMPKLGKFARLLGPKGLMPNPKAGTVTNDVEKAVKEAKAGKIEYRVDKQAIVHVGVGKVSFGAEKLLENTNAFLDSLKSQKPNSLKGSYVKSVFVTTTMGPSIQVENIYN